MILKTHNSQGRLILALCDDNLINKKLQEGGRVLDLDSGFFKGEKVDVSSVLPLIKKAYILNAVGKQSTDLLVKEGIITKEDLIFIAKTPTAQVLFEAKR